MIDIALAAVSRQDGEVVIRLRNLGVGVDQLLIGCHRFIPPSQVLENRRALKHQGDIPLIFGEALIRVLERLRVVSVRDHPVHDFSDNLMRRAEGSRRSDSPAQSPEPSAARKSGKGPSVKKPERPRG